MKELNDDSKKKLAYLIGAVMGDGCYTSPDRWGKRRFQFSSSDIEFVLMIKGIVRDIFSLEMSITLHKLSLKNNAWRDHYRVSSRILPRLLMEYLPDKNQTPLFIRHSSPAIKSEFISGFFDAEGGISLSTIPSRNALDRRVYCHNTNLYLLLEIKNYLALCDVNSFLQEEKRKRSHVHAVYVLNIWGYKNLVNFKNLIDFKIPRKKLKLFKVIQSYKLIHKKHRHLHIDEQKLQEVQQMTEDVYEEQESMQVDAPEEYSRQSGDEHTVFVGSKPFKVFS